MLLSLRSLALESAVLLSFLLLPSAVSEPLEDRVLFLPLFGISPTPHYSGYLDGTDGCDTAANGGFCKIHYWFAEAKTEPSNKPVVLWLNGGPGSSSILGFLQELGPLVFNATGGLMENPWSWTNVANVVVFESPIGVGYSYCENQDLTGTICKNTDKFTASTARAALVDFFTTKFPEYAKNEFFITGESYAGVYVPTLAKEVLDHASDVINLQGLAIGDPCTDNTAQQNSMDALWYGHKYGLVPDQDFRLLWYACNVRLPNPLTWNHRKKVGSGEETPVRHMFDYPGDNFRRDSETCRLAWRKFQLSSSDELSQSWKHLFIDDYSFFGPVSETEDNHMADFMNREDVKQALHVVDTPIDTWPSPQGGFHYEKEYDACNGHPEEDAWSMIDFYRNIAPRIDGPVWVYNGDTDPCVSYEGTRTAMTRVGFAELDGGGYRPWFYNHTAAPIEVIAEKARMFGPDLLAWPTGVQFGGEIVDYENGLSFLTIHGSGHMVPQFRPQAALHMVSKLVQKQPLSPLWPTNATLAKANDEDFRAIQENWTVSAMGEPFV